MGPLSRRLFLKTALLSTGAGPILWPSRPRTEAHNTDPETEKSDYPGYLNLAHQGRLSERVEKLSAFYKDCHLCPRDCRVNRAEGERGVCQAGARAKISSAFAHFGEEKPLVGRGGSGTVFFSHCGLRCVFCQNSTISIEGEGVEISDDRLAETMVRVQQFGCHNINLVTPTHFVPSIIRALPRAIAMGLKIPLVYNTSGYETPEVLGLLDGLIDIYLPDLKYMRAAAAAKYSSGAYNYPYYAKLAIKEMHRQVGELETDGRGVAVRGVILRHLIMPNRVAGTEELIQFVARELSPRTYVNLMAQYRPEYRAQDYPEIARRLTRNEYAEAREWAKRYGLSRLDR
jgi:putative pyruvate formate lyase activating enzyme